MRRILGVVLVLCVLAPGCGKQVAQAPMLRVFGRVVDACGRPVAGAEILAVKWQFYRKDAGPIKARTISASDGSFYMESVPAPGYREFYYLIAQRRGRYIGWAQGPDSTTAPESVANETFRIVVWKPGVLKSRVVDTMGKPIGGAKVVPEWVGLPGTARQYRVLHGDAVRAIADLKPGLTDSRGLFCVSGLPSHATVRWRVLKHGVAAQSARQEHGRLVVSAGGGIAGRLVDSKGRGIPGIRLNANAEGETFCWAAATTGKDGYYRIDGLLPGAYTVFVVQEVDFAARSVRGVRVAAGKIAKAKDTVAGRGVLVEGTLVDAKTGEPVMGGTVYAYSRERNTGSIKTTDSQGRFRLRTVPGDYVIAYVGGNSDYGTDTCTPKTVTVPKRGLRNVRLEVEKQDFAAGRVLAERGSAVSGAVIRVAGNRAVSGWGGAFRIAIPPEQGGGG